MKRICKICNRFISNQYGYCPICWNKLEETRRIEIKQQKAEKKGVITNTLKQYIGE